MHLDADHNIIDRHRSRLVYRLFDGPEGLEIRAGVGLGQGEERCARQNYLPGLPPFRMAETCPDKSPYCA